VTTAPGRGKFSPEQRAAIAADIEQTAGTPEGSYRKIAARHGWRRRHRAEDRRRKPAP
jgi:transposase-like protein